MLTNRSRPNGTVVPSLVYDDVGKAIDWLVDVFGFTERLRISGPDGKVGHAQLATQGLGGLLLSAAHESYRQPRAGEVSYHISVQVDDVDPHYERARERGARILHAPVTYPYGERQYSVEDLGGHRWSFSQAITDVEPEDWGATVAEIKGPLTLLARPRLCYLEIPASDVRESAGFYERVFGWNIRHRDSDRPSFDDATGYVSGAWITGRPAAREPGLLPYIWVDRIDAVLSQAASNGGEVVEPPHLDSPGGAWVATLRDPAGNLIGLYEEAAR